MVCRRYRDSQRSEWNDLAIQQLVRYEALFELLDDIQMFDNIADIANRVATQWKYFANVANWRMVILNGDRFTVIDGFRGQATLRSNAELDAWDRFYWTAQLPRLVRLDENADGPSPPLHMNGCTFVEVEVLPFFRGDSYLGLLSVAARHEPFSDLDKRFIRLFGGFFLDRVHGIIQQRLTNDALLHRATHDVLTGLFNREAIFERLVSQLALSQRTRQPLSVILCDIDFFKSINDQHGHLIGDEILREVAKRLDDQIREGECLGRFGGEEFLVVLYPCDKAQAAHVAERMRRSIESDVFRTHHAVTPNLRVTVSLGTCSTGSACDWDMNRLLSCADKALYQSKAAGRNRVTVADDL